MVEVEAEPVRNRALENTKARWWAHRACEVRGWMFQGLECDGVDLRAWPRVAPGRCDHRSRTERTEQSVGGESCAG